MDFKQLRTFVEVVHTGNFTDAARNLFLSQPTVSQHIRQIEEEMGTRLIRRSTRRIQVTDEGRKMCAYAEDILALKDRMVANCSGKTHQILSIGASTIPSAYILPDVLRRFGAQCPEAYFSIHQSDSAGVEKGVAEGVYDLGLTGRKPETEDLDYESICSDKMVLITPVTPYFLEKKANGAGADELLDQPIILREEGSGSLKAADLYLEAQNISESSLHIVARINDQEAIKNMVAGGMGVSFISNLAAGDYAQSKRILCFDLPEETAARSFYVIRRKGDMQSGMGAEFVHFLKHDCR